MAGDFYYVKTDGVNDGTKATGALTKQSGSFASLGVSAYYPTIAAAITGGAGAGDYICCSDAHSYTSTVNIAINGPAYATTPPQPLIIVSVSDTNCDAYSAGAIEQTTGTNPDINFVGILNIAGVNFSSSDLLFFGFPIPTC